MFPSDGAIIKFVQILENLLERCIQVLFHDGNVTVGYPLCLPSSIASFSKKYNALFYSSKSLYVSATELLREGRTSVFPLLLALDKALS